MNSAPLDHAPKATMPVRGGAPRTHDTRPTLLIVEDDEALLKTLCRTLADKFDVTPAPDGAAAADLLVTRNFDSVLSDIGLPGMSGVDLLRLVRSYDLDVPVVLMTGHPSLETAIQAFELGALTYVQKPFSTEALERTLDRASKLSRLARAKRTAIEVGSGGGGPPLAGDLAGLHTSFDRALSSLSLVFQPLVDRQRKRTFGFEALVRSREPSMPNPALLLEAADRLGRLADIGRRVRALAAAAFSPREEADTLFVNVHPADLLDPDLYDASAPLTRIADHVVLEITERASLGDLTETKHRTAELRRRGFRIAIDDLGAGYAGLTSFATFEPEVVKLDMTLIRGIESSPVRRHVVESMTRLCRELNMKVVAEGIETMPELGCILQLGCDYLQGYLLGRPGPALTPSELTW